MIRGKTKNTNRLISVFLAFFIAVSVAFSGNLTVNAALSIDTAAADATYTNIADTPIWCESTITAQQQAEVLIGWYLVPASVKEKYIEYGGKIYVTSSTSEDAVGTAFPSRITTRPDGLITGRLDDPYVVISTSSNDISATVIHEIGHILDMTIALCESGTFNDTFYQVSDAADWQRLYTTYYDTLCGLDFRCSYICNLSSDQAFAELFRVYCENPYLLVSNVPEVFLYIQQVVEAYT